MPRHFNIAGPCNPDIHYMLSPLARIPKVMGRVGQQAYFVIHAPRQIGKTTAMMALAQELTKSGKYVGVLVSVEEADAFPHDIGAADTAQIFTDDAIQRAFHLTQGQPWLVNALVKEVVENLVTDRWDGRSDWRNCERS
jgi:hypothetical protein